MRPPDPLLRRVCDRVVILVISDAYLFACEVVRVKRLVRPPGRAGDRDYRRARWRAADERAALADLDRGWPPERPQ